MGYLFFLFSALVIVLFGCCESCVYDAKHCACSPRALVSGKGICFDFVSDIAGTSEKVCTPRPCEDGYVCDCDGASYCSHEDVMRQVLEPIGNGNCNMVSKTINAVLLVNANISEVRPDNLANNDTCVFNDTSCTCSSTVDIGIIQECFDFLYEDPVKGPVCRVRDCNESMQCDCGGSTKCSKELRTISAFRKTGDEGRVGFSLCEQFQSTAFFVSEMS